MNIWYNTSEMDMPFKSGWNITKSLYNIDVMYALIFLNNLNFQNAVFSNTNDNLFYIYLPLKI